MATELQGLCISLPAASDLNGKQFYLVKQSGGSAALCAAVTDQSIGILQNEPNTGQAATIMVSGLSKFVAGGSVAVGVQLASDSAGKGTALTVAAGGTVYNYAVGRVTQAANAANEVGQVILYPGGLPLLV